MKIVIISDTHGQHAELGALEGDVLIHCGDFTFGRQRQAQATDALDAWFARCNFQHILCTGGNHDFLADEAAAGGARVFRHAHYLRDQALVLDGVKFYGAPWVPELAGWAHYRTDAELLEDWARIPGDTDVLITHTPPLGILDRNSSGKACGCPYLRDAVNVLRPQLHCFGHVHASAGVMRAGDTTYVNASVVNKRYEVKRAPIEVNVVPRCRD